MMSGAEEISEMFEDAEYSARLKVASKLRTLNQVSRIFFSIDVGGFSSINFFNLALRHSYVTVTLYSKNYYFSPRNVQN